MRINKPLLKRNLQFFFINKLDEEHTSFDASYQALREEFGKSVIPFEVPIVEDGKIVGSVNIIKIKLGITVQN